MGSCWTEKEKRWRWYGNRKSIVGLLLFTRLNLEACVREGKGERWRPKLKLQVRLTLMGSGAEVLSHLPCATPINLQLTSEVKRTQIT